MEHDQNLLNFKGERYFYLSFVTKNLIDLDDCGSEHKHFPIDWIDNEYMLVQGCHEDKYIYSSVDSYLQKGAFRRVTHTLDFAKILSVKSSKNLTSNTLCNLGKYFLWKLGFSN